MGLHRRPWAAILVTITLVAYCESSAEKEQGLQHCAKDVKRLFKQAKIPILGGLCNSTLLPGILSSLNKKYKDVINKKYPTATRNLMHRIRKAVQIFESYNEMVNKKRVLWYVDPKLSTTTFDALRGLKIAHKEFINTISKGLADLKGLNTTLSHEPDIVKQTYEKNGPCFMGGYMYRKEDCEDCRKSITGFKSKDQSMSELKQMILKMQTKIPKQLLSYANEIFVIVGEAIGTIDKIWTCLETEKDATKCEPRNKSIVLFTEKMEDIAKKQNVRMKMVISARKKLQKNGAKLIPRVMATMDGMANCLNFKIGVSVVDLLNKGHLTLPDAPKN